MELFYTMQSMTYSDKNVLNMYNSEMIEFVFKTFGKVIVSGICKDEAACDYGLFAW